MEYSLPEVQLEELVRQWYLEDQSGFDVAGGIFQDHHGVAHIYCKESCRMSGRPFVNAVFRAVQCLLHWNYKDGDYIDTSNGTVTVAVVKGKVRNLLRAERIALNCITRMSGITTQTNRYVQLLASAGVPTRVACTRKTTPGFRLAEKYAVVVGGGDPHRYDLASLAMLKDNHIKAFNDDIAQAVAKTREILGIYSKIEVEARNPAQAEAACSAGAEVVMLDNFSPEDAQETATKLKATYPHVLFECSGGIRENNLLQYASPSIDVLSVGVLTQGYPAIDFSMKIVDSSTGGINLADGMKIAYRLG